MSKHVTRESQPGGNESEYPELMQIQRPLKVVFVCSHGIAGSSTMKASFEFMLRDMGLEDKFEFDMVGVESGRDGIPPHDDLLFKKKVQGADFLVPVYTSRIFQSNFDKKLELLGDNKPEIIRLDTTTGIIGNRRMVEKALREIEKRLESRKEPGS